MKSLLLRTMSLIISLLCVATSASADIKVKIKTTMSGQSYEGTTYIKKSRQRTEQNMGVMRTANILQCDLRRNIQINDNARTYLITPFETGDRATQPAGATPKTVAPNPGATRRGGVITYTTTITDTGERKQMFGLTARHLKTSMTAESSPDACTPQKMRMETDGWYVDLQYGLDCEWNNRPNVAAPQVGKPDCVDEYRFKTVGSAKLGYPLLQTTTFYDENGQQTYSMTTEALEVSNATLDPALFDIPAGYTEVKSMQELYAPAATTRPTTQPSIPAVVSEPSEEAVKGTTAAPATLAGTVLGSAPKKAGAVRIGVVVPKTQMTDISAGVDAAEAVRNTLVGYINGPAIEVVLLSARLPEQAFAEARESQCDYVLFSGLTQKKGGGMFGKVLGSVASATASHIPYGGGVGEAIARTATTTVIYTTVTLSSSVKAKDELTFDYKLQTTDSSQKIVATNTTKAKAKSDGEDVITPMVEKAGQIIVAAVRK